MPIFTYVLNGIEHRYFPDAYIPSENIIYEVKSIWTVKLDQEKNALKYQAVKDSGYKFKLKIYK